MGLEGGGLLSEIKGSMALVGIMNNDHNSIIRQWLTVEVYTPAPTFYIAQHTSASFSAHACMDINAGPPYLWINFVHCTNL